MSDTIQFCKDCVHVVWEGYGGNASQCKATPKDLPADLVTGPAQDSAYCAQVRGLWSGNKVGSPTCQNYEPRPEPRARFRIIWTGPRLLLAIAVASLIGWLIGWWLQ